MNTNASNFPVWTETQDLLLWRPRDAAERANKICSRLEERNHTKDLSAIFRRDFNFRSNYSLDRPDTLIDYCNTIKVIPLPGGSLISCLLSDAHTDTSVFIEDWTIITVLTAGGHAIKSDFHNDKASPTLCGNPQTSIILAPGDTLALNIRKPHGLSCARHVSRPDLVQLQDQTVRDNFRRSLMKPDSLFIGLLSGYRTRPTRAQLRSLVKKNIERTNSTTRLNLTKLSKPFRM